MGNGENREFEREGSNEQQEARDMVGAVITVESLELQSSQPNSLFRSENIIRRNNTVLCLRISKKEKKLIFPTVS